MLKIYRLNKDFIPKQFYEKSQNELAEQIKKSTLVFLLCNLLMLPININNIENNHKKIQTLEVEQNDLRCDIKSINKWIEILNNNEIIEAYVTKGDTYIKLSNIDEFYEGNLKENLNVKYINNDQNLYTFGVELNE